MRIYLSGKIDGDPDYEDKFNKIEEELSSEGEIVNPAKLAKELQAEFMTKILEEPKYGDYLLYSLNHIPFCNVIYMLKDWKESKGAKVEHAFAEALGINILYENS